MADSEAVRVMLNHLQKKAGFVTEESAREFAIEEDLIYLHECGDYHVCMDPESEYVTKKIQQSFVIS